MGILRLKRISRESSSKDVDLVTENGIREQMKTQILNEVVFFWLKNYFKIDLTMIWKIITENLPKTKKVILKMKEKLFDK